jgi:hypothetical protein
LQLGEIARPIPYPFPQGGWFFGYPYLSQDNNQDISKWQQPLSKAVPYPPPRQGYHLFIPKEAVVDNTTTKLWPLAFGEKARPYPRWAPQGYAPLHPVQPFVTPSNLTTTLEWLLKWDNPPRYSLNIQSGGTTFFQVVFPTPIPPIPPIPAKAMTVRFSMSTGFGKDAITEGKGRATVLHGAGKDTATRGRGQATVTRGKGKPKIEHDP